MFEWVRERVAFYGSSQAYWPVLALHGLEELGHKLNAMTRLGKWAEMAKEVPDECCVITLLAGLGLLLARMIAEDSMPAVSIRKWRVRRFPGTELDRVGPVRADLCRDFCSRAIAHRNLPIALA
jgi:hypothetical protein